MTTPLRRSHRKTTGENDSSANLLPKKNLHTPSRPPFQSANTSHNSAKNEKNSSKPVTKPSSPSSTSSEGIHPGARCAVSFVLDRDFFGTRPNPETLAGAWYPATIQNVHNDDQTVDLVYDDQKQPDNNVDISELRLLQPRGQHEWEFADDQTLFANHDPTELHPGDLVFGRYQNDTAWYRGRVAYVRAAFGTCDIAYDDGDYEEHAPYGPQHKSGKDKHVILLERGSQNTNWLLGLEVPIPYRGLPKGTVVDVTSKKVKVRYNLEGQGNKIFKSYQYKGVVRGLFQEAAANPKLIKMQWPTTTTATSKGASKKRATSKKATTSRKRNKTQDENEDKPNRKNTTTTTKRTTIKKTLDDDDDEAFFMDVELEKQVLVDNKNHNVPQRKSSRRATKRLVTLEEEEDEDMDKDQKVSKMAPKSKKAASKKKKNTMMVLDNVDAIAETVHKLQLKPEPPEPCRKLKEIQQMKVYSETLNSAESVFGADLLKMLLVVHDRIPDDEMWQVLVKLNSFGPAFGSTKFMDPRKMALCNEYLDVLFAQKGVLSTFVHHVDEHFSETHKNTTYADAFVAQMLSPYYVADGDASRTSKGAVERIHATFQAKASSARVFARVLDHVLRPHVVADQNGENMEDEYQSLPIVSDICSARRGSKDALEKVVQAMGQSLMQAHSLLVGNWEEMEASEGDLSFAMKELMDLLKCFGKIISHLAWLYSKEANESVDSLADIIGAQLLLAMETSFTADGESDDSERLRIAAKLRFVENLEKEVVSQLRPKLADRLGIAQLYNMCVGS